MKKIGTLLFFLCNAFLSNAQSRWQILPDTGLFGATSSRFEDVYFTDSVTGFAVTLGGGIYKTIDAGRNWSGQNFYSNLARFRSIEFLDDKLTGVAGSLGPNFGWR